jgi:hypothetical protein
MSEPADSDQPDFEAEDTSAAPGHSLWNVMRHDAEEASADDPDASEQNGTEPTEQNKADMPDDSARPKGLWSVIEHGDEVEGKPNDQQSAESSDTDSPEIESPNEDDIEFESAAEFDEEGDEDFDDKSLESSDATVPEPAESHSSDAEGEAAGSNDDFPGTDGIDAAVRFPLAVQLDVPEPKKVSVRSGPTHASQSLVLGPLAAALSALCLLPVAAIWLLPTVVGGAALLYGCLAVGGGRRNSDQRAISASVGMLLGLVGIFAGPLWLNEAGDRWRHEQTSRAVTNNLQNIGAALSAFHDEQGRFPPGGTFRDSADGLPVGMHGWMTDLLPHHGHEELASQIDRRRPWSDPANGPALKTRVDAYLTPGTPYELTSTGHAPTHFAGVGGRVETDFGTGDLGIFGRNSQVARDDVIDGLSQTMVAGEIAQSIPAWGEPDNWRSIGAGLNKSPQGFGNTDDTGAHFLMADGSVRFLSNRTSLRTLQQLGTRNGSEPESR